MVLRSVGLPLHLKPSVLQNAPPRRQPVRNTELLIQPLSHLNLLMQKVQPFKLRVLLEKLRFFSLVLALVKLVVASRLYGERRHLRIEGRREDVVMDLLVAHFHGAQVYGGRCVLVLAQEVKVAVHFCGIVRLNYLF